MEKENVKNIKESETSRKKKKEEKKKYVSRETCYCQLKYFPVPRIDRQLVENSPKVTKRYSCF